MAEEEDPWAFDESTDTKTEETPAEGEAAPAGGDSAAPGAEGEAGTGEEGSEQPLPPAEDDQYRKPVQLYRHWVRPKFLQYKYMYNYRTNYYDDVIDYLDKKQRGVIREIPRAQTWAERVLRTNTGSYRYPYLDTPGILLSSRYWDPQYAYWWLSLDSGRSYEHGLSKHRDVHLIQTLAASIKTHNYHSTAYINRKYSSVL